MTTKLNDTPVSSFDSHSSDSKNKTNPDSGEDTPNVKLSNNSNDSAHESSTLVPHKYHYETLYLPVYQRQDRTIYVLITFPTITTINDIKGQTLDGSDTLIEYKMVSLYGSTTGTAFNEQYKFVPGDYYLGLWFRNADEANRIVSIQIGVQMDSISNLMIVQILSGLYRSLGYEPSHVLKYPSRSAITGSPIHHKIRADLSKASTDLSTKIATLGEQMLKTNWEELSTKITNLSEQMSELGDQEQISERFDALSDQMTKMVEQPDVLSSKVAAISEQISKIKPEAIIGRIGDLGEQISKIGPDEKIMEHISQLKNVGLKGLSDENIKINRELEDINRKINSLIVFMNEFLQKITEMANSKGESLEGEKGGDDSTISVVEFQNLIKEKETYFNKLIEAEDYIEYLQRSRR